MTKLFLVLLLFVSFTAGVSLSAGALERGTIRASALAGQVGLFGDPGTGGANGLGLGVGAGFQISDPLALEIRYLNSSPSNVTHSDLTVGAEYAFADFESGSPHAELGLDFITNNFKNASISYSGSGIYAGVGLDLELARDFQIGPEVRYVKSFSSQGAVNNVSITIIGDSYSLLLRLSYLFGRGSD